MVVSDRLKALAILIPKTGTRSIVDYMKKHYGGRVIYNHRTLIPNEYKDYLSFCVVRNPYTRVVSLWYSGSQRGKKSERKYQFQEVTGGKSFVSYLRYLVHKDSYEKDLQRPFILKQVDYMKNNYDYILQFENLRSDMKRLPFFKASHRLERHNETVTVNDINPKARKPWYMYYDQETLELVNQYFGDDFQYLNKHVFGREVYPMFESIEELRKYGEETGEY